MDKMGLLLDLKHAIRLTLLRPVFFFTGNRYRVIKPGDQYLQFNTGLAIGVKRYAL